MERMSFRRPGGSEPARSARTPGQAERPAVRRRLSRRFFGAVRAEAHTHYVSASYASSPNETRFRWAFVWLSKRIKRLRK